MPAEVQGGGAANLAQMQAAFADAQNVQAQITSETTKHQTVMSLLESIKNAFQQIKA